MGPITGVVGAAVTRGGRAVVGAGVTDELPHAVATTASTPSSHPARDLAR
jgi:hypothetical protein